MLRHRGLPSYGGADGEFQYGTLTSSRSSKRSSGGGAVVWAVGALLMLVCSGLGWTLMSSRTQLAQLTEQVGNMEMHLNNERVSAAQLSSVATAARGPGRARPCTAGRPSTAARLTLVCMLDSRPVRPVQLPVML